MSRVAVLANLGVPEASEEQKTFGARIDKFGAIQISYQSDSVVAIYYDPAPAPQETPGPLVVHSGINPYEVAALCENLALNWMINQSLSYDHKLTITTATGVTLFFDLGQRELSRIAVDSRIQYI